MSVTMRRQAGLSLVELMVALLLLGRRAHGAAAAFAPGRIAIQSGDQSRDTGPAVSGFGEAPPVAVQERPSRKSRRLEARMAIQEAQRKQRERLRGPAGPPMFDEKGKLVMD